jgi:DNA repair protein RadA/Sms
VYVSVAGGVRVGEPAADLPLALALASARGDTALPAALVAFGEIGLAGEVRPVAHAAVRVAEAAAMGLTMVVTGPSRGLTAAAGTTITSASSIGEAVALVRGSR